MYFPFLDACPASWGSNCSFEHCRGFTTALAVAGAPCKAWPTLWLVTGGPKALGAGSEVPPSEAPFKGAWRVWGRGGGRRSEGGRGLHLRKASRGLQGGFKGASKRASKGAWRGLHLEGGFKGAWRGLQGGLKQGGRGGLKGAWRGLHLQGGFRRIWPHSNELYAYDKRPWHNVTRLSMRIASPVLQGVDHGNWIPRISWWELWRWNSIVKFKVNLVVGVARLCYWDWTPTRARRWFNIRDDPIWWHSDTSDHFVESSWFQRRNLQQNFLFYDFLVLWNRPASTRCTILVGFDSAMDDGHTVLETLLRWTRSSRRRRRFLHQWRGLRCMVSCMVGPFALSSPLLELRESCSRGFEEEENMQYNTTTATTMWRWRGSLATPVRRSACSTSTTTSWRSRRTPRTRSWNRRTRRRRPLHRRLTMWRWSLMVTKNGKIGSEMDQKHELWFWPRRRSDNLLDQDGFSFELEEWPQSGDWPPEDYVGPLLWGEAEESSSSLQHQLQVWWKSSGLPSHGKNLQGGRRDHQHWRVQPGPFDLERGWGGREWFFFVWWLHGSMSP